MWKFARTTFLSPLFSMWSWNKKIVPVVRPGSLSPAPHSDHTPTHLHLLPHNTESQSLLPTRQLSSQGGGKCHIMTSHWTWIIVKCTTCNTLNTKIWRYNRNHGCLVQSCCLYRAPSSQSLVCGRHCVPDLAVMRGHTQQLYWKNWSVRVRYRYQYSTWHMWMLLLLCMCWCVWTCTCPV